MCLFDKDRNILIDSSSEDNEEELVDGLKELGLEVFDINVVLLTHRYWDYVENSELFSNAEVFDFRNINDFKLEGFKVFKVPGHTRDSLAFLYSGVLFSGDTCSLMVLVVLILKRVFLKKLMKVWNC